MHLHNGYSDYEQHYCHHAAARIACISTDLHKIIWIRRFEIYKPNVSCILWTKMSLTRPGEVPGASKVQAILRKMRGVASKIRLRRCVSWEKCSSDEDILTCIHLVEDANPRAEMRSDLRGVRQKLFRRPSASAKQEVRTLVQKSATIPSVSKRNSLPTMQFLPQNTMFGRHFPP